MIEAGVSALVAVIAGGAAITNRLHNRINELDRRVDAFELRVATDYVPQEQFSEAVIRIENKLDQMLLKNS
jgi:hypothetical protein